jgi:rare lipoprotein A
MRKVLVSLLISILPLKMNLAKKEIPLEHYSINLEGRKKKSSEKKSKKSGLVSYYANKFHGRKTASGALYDSTALTAAHRSYSFGTQLLLTNPKTGESVVVVVNDRGPFCEGRVLDVSLEAAKRLGLLKMGVGKLDIKKI